METRARSRRSEGPFHHSTDPDTIDVCGRLVVERYLSDGWIVPENIDERTGCLTVEFDPCVPHSEYFLIADPVSGEPQATGRYITVPIGARGDAQRLPVEADFELFSATRERIGAARILDPGSVVEVSGLARKLGAEASMQRLYRAMWHHAIRAGYRVLLMRVEAAFVELAFANFGRVFEPAGPEVASYLRRGRIVPMLFEPATFLHAMTSHMRGLRELHGDLVADQYRQVIDFFLDGLEDHEIALLAAPDIPQAVRPRF
ncbi:hypothetical protein AB0K51_32330 [Kitasatospora sp. NPDC049285]|uniref:hypothetical protein n=1 Tax=Kitasatospora sp. NPDC049285 TaxID=3157096 RepID=UPI0034130510